MIVFFHFLGGSSGIIQLSGENLKPSSEFLVLSCGIDKILIKTGDSSAGLDLIFLSDDGFEFEDFPFEVFVLILKLMNFGIGIGDSFAGLTEFMLESSSEFLVFLVKTGVGLFCILKDPFKLIVLSDNIFELSLDLSYVGLIGTILAIDLNLDFVSERIFKLN